MAKKINIETNTSALTREELATLAKVSNDVFTLAFHLCDTPYEGKGKI